MSTYYAISTENAALNGWTVLAVADDHDVAQAVGRRRLPGGYDMRADTWRKNFAVTCKSRAPRGLREDSLRETLLRGPHFREDCDHCGRGIYCTHNDSTTCNECHESCGHGWCDTCEPVQ